MRNSIVNLHKVNKTFGSGNSLVHALKNVDLSIPEAAFMTVTGPSGSGKSTLLHILGFLDEPTSGFVEFEGLKIKISDFNSLSEFRSRKIGFIFQSFNLIPVLSAEENIAVPLIIRKDIGEKEKKERVKTLLHAIGLESHAHQKPDELSGGQKQRVAVARSIVCHPALVLADEPTANLDTENAELVLKIMSKMNEDYGTAFVFSTHDPRIDKYAKQKVVLRDGAVTSLGPG